jgi:hypothetical protein
MESADNFHALIKRGADAGEVEIACHIGFVKSRSAPIYSWADSNIPALFLIILVALNFLLAGLVLGVLSLACCAVFFFTYVRRWIKRRMRKRARVLVLASADNWVLLWNQGGLSIRLSHDPEVYCDSPDGNWVDFVRDHLMRGDLTEMDAKR